ncbi:MAG: asparagine synthase (glutamine-hydrolyzing) [Deltaproteobacteria bacterium]|nr:asparagine synthase (glutamine-hydrolyzing) [Deltaproteobacteria bacterium]
MCGIAGFYHREGKPIPLDVLERMTRTVTYRGPDEEGYHHQAGLGLGHRRLSIIDLSGGRQPIYNEDRTVFTVFNGEIFNYVELRAELEQLGHRFASRSDTEVIVHGYEEWGRRVLDRLNGQFAIAVFDARSQRLLLARDRLGIRPVFFADAPDGAFVFGSEMKVLFAYPGIRPALDGEGLGQIFTFWVNVPPRTVFAGISELGPGEWLEVDPAGRRSGTFWRLSFPEANAYADRPLSHWTEALRAQLFDATRLQLRADVPVASYLSGGLDSSVISTVVKREHAIDLTTFSVAFSDPHFDEREHQRAMVDFLGTHHHMIEVDEAIIGRDFSRVVALAERPMLRTAPAPLYRLAGLVRDKGIKVVLTGEGADEILGGYSIFREDKVRRFWARQPDSRCRPLLLGALHPEAHREGMARAFWTAFFKKGLTETSHRYYSHLIRWRNTAQLQSLFLPDWRERFGTFEQHLAALDAYLSPDLMRWDPLSRAQYLETVLFLPGYLLSSQGDRLMMGQSIEGRFPFLDHRLVELAATIPPEYRLHRLNEKYVLKQAYQGRLPPAILERPKQPYRASISQCFQPEQKNEASALLEPEAMAAFGYFEPGHARSLLAKAAKTPGGRLSDRDDMGLVMMASMQLLHHHFLAGRG